MQKKNKKKPIRIIAGQSIYLTLNFYFQNNLDNSASACAFGFLFSFIPITMMIVAILVTILHSSPQIINVLLEFAEQFKDVFDIKPFINSLMKIHSFNWVEFLLAVFIFWMARKFFITVMQGMFNIFHTAAPARPVFNQILIIAGELLLVILTVATVIALFTIKQFFTLPVFDSLQQKFPSQIHKLSGLPLTLVSYLLIFIFVTFAYRFASGTKPSLKLCAVCAALCSAVFYVISRFMSVFMNVNNYNIIYGVLSGLIIILLEVYVFFTLFLLFAQFIFVRQFFDLLQLGELYLLPKKEDKGFFSMLRRMLFITPAALIKRGDMLKYKAGDVIYSTQDSSNDAFYIVKGAITLDRSGSKTKYSRGDFFGELSSILQIPVVESATAETDCDVIQIDAASFRALLEQNPKVAAKAISQVSEYVAKVYGRTDDFLV